MMLGVILILIGSYLSIYVSNYLSKSEQFKGIISNLPSFIPLEFIVSFLIFTFLYLIYNFIKNKKYNKLFEDIENINSILNEFVSQKRLPEGKFLTPIFEKTIYLLKSFEKEYQKLEEKSKSKIEGLEEEVKELEAILDLENVLICEVNEAGKVKRANKEFLKFFGFENVMKLNMSIKNIQELFGDELKGVYLNELLHQEPKLVLNDKNLLLKVVKLQNKDSYVMTLIDITNFEEEKREIEKKVLYANGNLKSVKAINKTFQIVMIRILNYENYAAHLGIGILEVFEEKFVEKIQSLGYDEIFKVQNDIFAIYDLKIDYDRYKKVLEESIKIVVAGDTYIFNPKVILAGGVNFDQAYQQVLESTKTLISKEKNSVKYHPEMIKLLNNNVANSNVVLGYNTIEGKNDTILITPVMQDEYGMLIDQKVILSMAREFNLYLMMIKQLVINNLNILKNHKVIINVTSEELLSTTILADLLSLIKREDLFVIFNIDINSKYSVVYPILKQIKSFAQLGIRNVGRGYISFKDIYALKIEYLEIDDSIIDLIKTNSQWEFLLDSVKILVSAQNTKLLAHNYKDNKVLKISNELKIYQN